jgi:hypothetical protein
MFLAVVFSVAMLASCKLTEWVEDNKPDIPDFPTTTTTTIPASVEQEHGFSHPEQVVATLSNGNWTKSGITYTSTPRSWTVVDGCDGEAFLGVKRDGKWLVGKFDHARKNDAKRDWNNLTPEKPYGKWKEYGVPVAGEQVCFFILKYPPQTERTSAIFGVWK